MKRGEIWLAAFDPAHEHEQKCRRKAPHSISLENIVSWRRKVKERPFRACPEVGRRSRVGAAEPSGFSPGGRELTILVDTIFEAQREETLGCAGASGSVSVPLNS